MKYPPLPQQKNHTAKTRAEERPLSSALRDAYSLSIAVFSCSTAFFSSLLT